MKSILKLSCLLITILIAVNISFSQSDPITIQFVEAQPLWEHVIYDTAFFNIGNQPEINKYTVVVPYKSFRFEDDLLILSLAMNYNGETYGYILEQLDIESGQIKWQNYSTYYNEGIQDFYKDLYLRPDGQLEMVGIKRHGIYVDTIFAGWNVGSGKSNFVRKVFDYNTGHLINTTVSKDSIGNIIPTYLTFYPVVFDSIYIVAHQLGTQVGDNFVWGFDFFKLDESNSMDDTLSSSEIIFESSNTMDFWAYGQPPFIQKLNDTTLVCLLFQNRWEPEITKAQLLWINIADLNNITVTKRLNVEELIPGDEISFLYLIFKIENETIFIHQPYYDFESSILTTYLTVVDNDGTVLHYLPRCNEIDPFYEALSLIYTGTNFYYFAGFPSKTGRSGFDILKLSSNSDSLHYVSSLTSANQDEEFTRQLEVSRLYDDGKFIIGAYTKKLGSVENSAVKYYAFNAFDLGMDIINSSVQVQYDELSLKIYPNPMSDVINIEMKDSNIGIVKVYNSYGRCIGFINVEGKSEAQLSLEDYPQGIYFLRFQNIHGPIQTYRICLLK